MSNISKCYTMLEDQMKAMILKKEKENLLDSSFEKQLD